MKSEGEVSHHAEQPVATSVQLDHFNVNEIIKTEPTEHRYSACLS